MSTVIPQPVLQNSNGQIGSNRSLLKNIKNNLPTTSTNIKKNDIKLDNSKVSNTKNNLRTPSKKNKDNGLIFTPSTGIISQSKPKEENLVIEEIETVHNTSLDGIIEQMLDQHKSPMKEETNEIVITAAESLSIQNVLESIDCKTVAVSVDKKISYSFDLLLSMRFNSKCTVKPVEVDFVISNQNEIVVPSKPNTPYVHKQPIQTPSRSNQRPNQSPISSPIYKNGNHSTFNTPFHLPMTSPVNTAQKTPMSIPFHLPTSSLKKQTPKNNTSQVKQLKQQTPKSRITTPIKLQEEFQKVDEKSVVPTTSTTTVTVDTVDQTVPSTSSVNVTKKPRETDPKRLAARQRQIDIGKMTAGYKNFIATVPKSKRKSTDPKTPNKNQVCSKRSWDGQVRKWRRLLHQYDPEAPKIDEEEMKQLTKVDEEDGEGEYLEDDDEEEQPKEQTITTTA